MDFALQYLKHGRALCGAVFGCFVETFNRLVDFYANLKGDGDVSDDGLITIDRTDPAHLIIRMKDAKTSAASGGGSVRQGAFELVADKSSGGYKLENCVFNVGGRTYASAELTCSLVSDSYLCAKFSLSSVGGVEVESYGSISELVAPQSSAELFIVPLYKIGAFDDSGAPLFIVDLRNAPSVQSFESDLIFPS